MKWWLFICAFPIFAVLGTPPLLDIKLHSGIESEKKAQTVLETLSEKYDLKPYLFTRHILIQTKVVPHSHPILTLNTRQINEPSRYLGLLLHEETHWFFESRENRTKSFISIMKAKFPTVPFENSEIKDSESTYLHLGVCYYELAALSKLLGEKEAGRIFRTEDVYPWEREKVLKNREFIGKALVDSGLEWKDAEQN